MKDFIVNNYTIIIIIAAFLLFALIGFLVDQSKNSKSKEAKILTETEEENKETKPEPIAVPEPENKEIKHENKEIKHENKEPVIEIPEVDDKPKDSK